MNKFIEKIDDLVKLAKYEEAASTVLNHWPEIKRRLETSERAKEAVREFTDNALTNYHCDCSTETEEILSAWELEEKGE